MSGGKLLTQPEARKRLRAIEVALHRLGERDPGIAQGAIADLAQLGAHIEPAVNAGTLTGKLLTPSEFEEIRSFKPEFLRPSVIETLCDHIEAVGVFAPDAPTDDEIAECLAKAQGFVRVVGGWQNRDRTLPEPYEPASNLGQALEAAAALRHRCGSVGAAMHGAEAVALGVLTSSEAARNLCVWMYDRLQARKGEQP